jgi:hypothetical protein
MESLSPEALIRKEPHPSRDATPKSVHEKEYGKRDSMNDIYLPYPYAQEPRWDAQLIGLAR